MDNFYDFLPKFTSILISAPFFIKGRISGLVRGGPGLERALRLTTGRLRDARAPRRQQPIQVRVVRSQSVP